MQENGFLRLSDVLKLFPVSRATWWRGINSGKYPKGVKLGERVTAWRVSDIRELIERTQAPVTANREKLLDQTGDRQG